MGLLPSAPKVEVFAPTTLFAGRPVSVQVVVTAKDETKIDFIDVRITGKQGWAIGSGDSRVAENAEYPRLIARLATEGVLPAGVSNFSTTFTLPVDMPPTHEMDPAHARLELYVHVSIPWWLDGRSKFLLPVRTPPPAQVVRTPYAVRSSGAADGPRLEVSLASTRLIVGETLVGSCAVFHMDEKKSREVEIELASTIQLHRRGRTRERAGDTYGFKIQMPPNSAGTSVPFQFAVPAAVVPTFATHTHNVSWRLTASCGSFFGGKVHTHLPLEIVDASAAQTTQRLAVAPRLADKRVTAIFERFAEHRGWHRSTGEDDGLEGNPLFERDDGDSVLQIGYAYRGEEGTFLVGQVLHPALGLALAISPSSALRHVFFKDIEIDIDAWDRAHHVAAREALQAIPFLKAAVPSVVTALRALGTLVRWSDDRIVFERRVVDVEEHDLAAIEASLHLVATAIAAAEGTIPPPPDIVVDVPAWKQLAARWRGKLTVGDLSIEGTLDTTPVELGVVWPVDGRPLCVRAHVGDPAAASGETRAIAMSLARPASDALRTTGAERLVELLVGWPNEIVDLVVSDGVVSASLELTDGVADAARARELVESLRSVLAALDPAAGPYR